MNQTRFGLRYAVKPYSEYNSTLMAHALQNAGKSFRKLWGLTCGTTYSVCVVIADGKQMLVPNSSGKLLASPVVAICEVNGEGETIIESMSGSPQVSSIIGFPVIHSISGMRSSLCIIFLRFGIAR